MSNSVCAQRGWSVSKHGLSIPLCQPVWGAGDNFSGPLPRELRVSRKISQMGQVVSRRKCMGHEACDQFGLRGQEVSGCGRVGIRRGHAGPGTSCSPEAGEGMA